MTSKINLRTAQLLCSRICHDLVGPIGAVNTAIELMQDEGDDIMDVEAFKVLARSALEANRKLAFFRTVFGLGASYDSTIKTSGLIDLANGLVAAGKVDLLWDQGMPSDIPSISSKILMLQIFLAIEALPRGGAVHIRMQSFSDGDAIACIAEGEGAGFQTEVGNVLDGAMSENELTPRTIPSYVLTLLAEEAGATIELSQSQDGQIALAVLFSNGLSMVGRP